MKLGLYKDRVVIWGLVKHFPDNMLNFNWRIKNLFTFRLENQLAFVEWCFINMVKRFSFLIYLLLIIWYWNIIYFSWWCYVLQQLCIRILFFIWWNTFLLTILLLNNMICGTISRSLAFGVMFLILLILSLL